MRSSTRSNSGRSASQSGSIAAIAANGWLKKIRVRSASNCAAPADIRSSRSRCAWTKRASSARASSRSWTSIAKPATAPVGERHIDEPQHAPLAADGRRLDARHAAARSRAPPRRPRLALSSPGASTSSIAARDDVGRVARPRPPATKALLTRPRLQVGAAMPHRERRRLDQLGQRVERALGLAQAQREVGALGLGAAGVGQPQQHGAGRLGRRGRAAAHLEHARPSRRCAPGGQSVAAAQRRTRASRLGQRFEILGDNAAIVAGQLGKSRGTASRPSSRSSRASTSRPPSGRTTSGRAGARLEQAGEMCAPRRAPHWRRAGGARQAPPPTAAIRIHRAARRRGRAGSFPTAPPFPQFPRLIARNVASRLHSHTHLCVIEHKKKGGIAPALFQVAASATIRTTCVTFMKNDRPR